MNVEVRNRQRLLRVDASLLKAVTTQALELIGAAARYDLSIVLVNDATMAKLNAQYHATQGPTDILSFDYGEGQGELIISIEHVVANARRFQTAPARELTRYVAHGILHLHGYDDRTLRQRTRMRNRERCFLGYLGRKFDLRKLVT